MNNIYGRLLWMLVGVCVILWGSAGAIEKDEQKNDSIFQQLKFESFGPRCGNEVKLPSMADISSHAPLPLPDICDSAFLQGRVGGPDNLRPPSKHS